MSYMEDFSRYRPTSATPPIGSPNFGGYLDGVAQSFRSSHLVKPPSPLPRSAQPTKSSDGPPILKRHKIDFTPDECITHLAVGHNQVTIAMKDKKILVIDTTSGKESDCDLSRYLGNKIQQARIHKIFVDPTGKFTLISLAYASDNQPMENLLFVKRLQPLPRLKNHLISAVAWNHPRTNSTDSNLNSTGTILLGTTKGLILQTEFVHSDESKFFPLSPGSRQYVKEIFDVGPDVGAITGIEYHQIPSNSPTEKNFIVLVSTNNRLYRMVGSLTATLDPPPLHLIFTQNSNSYQDVPGRLTNAKLDFYYPSSNSPPTRFAWLTEPGAMTSEIPNQLLSCRSSFESTDDISIIPYNISRENETMQLLSSSTPSGISPPFSSIAAYYYDKPLSLAVSNFHVIVLFRYCIKAICILNEATVYEEYFSSKYGNVQGMCKDPIKGTLWVFCERAIFRYKVSNENKNIWKIYLEQKKFDLAKKYSSNDDSNYDRVICEEAQHYFRIEEYEKSAMIFARSKKPFEDVALMFMEIKSQKALKKYLMIRLEQFDPIQMTQITMTLAWLLEIIISSISILKIETVTDKIEKELEELNKELEDLLGNKQILGCLKRNSKLFYGIIQNYPDSETFVRVAEILGNYELVVQYHMDLDEFEKALEIMTTIKSDKLFYKHGHILIKKIPTKLVDALIKQPSIEPTKLIPILIQENPYFNKCAETIKYLEHCVNVRKSDSRVIHSYLFELYARHRDEDTLLNYLKVQLESIEFKSSYLDLQLCLRLCTELKLVRTCVALYSAMELYDDALNLALSFDIELAKSIAKRVDSEDHQKRLWLLIAKNILTKNLDVQIATNLLKECRLLKIEDILPFFPDYTTIDFFKDAIRQSLQEYKNQIMAIKDGTYDNIADEIRNEIQAFRSRYSLIKAGQRCEICSQNLLSRSFYLFPCGHLFHSECIAKEIISIEPLYKDKTELEQIILKECVYCGSLLADNIDKPPPIDSDDESN